MPTHVMVRPPSLQTSSTVSHDDIPPQPLDPDVGEADPVRRWLSHDLPPSNNHQLQDPSTTTGNNTGTGTGCDDHEEVAFHKLPDEVIKR